MENRLVYQSQADNMPDNQTIWRKLPYDTRLSAFFATNYGAILRQMKRGITVVPVDKCKLNPGSIAHGMDKRGGIRYLLNSPNAPIHHKLIYRLIAAAFCPNDDPKRNQVDHIDNNPANQRADNLRWVTQSENIRYYHEIKRGERIITNLQKSLFYVTY